jgi:hypothetical protein
LTVAHGERRRVAVGIHIHAIGPRLEQRHRAVRGVDLEALVVGEVAKPYLE